MSLTNSDFENLKIFFQQILDETLDRKLDQKLDEKIGHLPSKEEFYESQDKIAQELKTVREEMQILNGLHSKVNDHVTRIENLEKFTKIKTL